MLSVQFWVSPGVSIGQCDLSAIPLEASEWRQSPSSPASETGTSAYKRLPITVFLLPHPLLKPRFQRCQEVVWTFTLFLLPLHFCLGGGCGEDIRDAAFPGLGTLIP